MKTKLLIICFAAVFMLVAISYATAINNSNARAKESPLFKIRTRISINEKIGNIIEQIKVKFLGERVFFIPFRLVGPNQILPSWPDSYSTKAPVRTGCCDATNCMCK